MSAAIDALAERDWLRETEEESDDGERWSVIRLTDEGKAEWRRRNPLEQRLENAWFALGDVIYAPSEAIADRAVRTLFEDIGPPDVDVTVKNVQPWTYELDGSGDVIEGVRVEFPVPRRLVRLWHGLLSLPLALRIAAYRLLGRRRGLR